MRVLVTFCLITVVAQATNVERATVNKTRTVPKDLENLLKYRSRSHTSTGSRVTGGDAAIHGQFPHQVGLFVTNFLTSGFCGGSLLHEYWVLTAAHCVESAVSVEVIIGAHNIVDGDPHQVRVKAKRIVVHQNWDVTTIVDDIALLELPWPVQYSNYVQPIRLPRRSQIHLTFAEENGIVSGWGKDSDLAPGLSPVLRWTQNPILDHEVCTWFYFQRIINTMICLDGVEGRSACSGDTGGPMVVVDTDGTFTQVGVVSLLAPPICQLGWPAIYTRTSSYLDWIEINTGGAVFVRD